MFKGLNVSAAIGSLLFLSLCPKRTLIREAQDRTAIRECQKKGRRLDRHIIGRRFGMLFHCDVRFGRRFEERTSIRDRTSI